MDMFMDKLAQKLTAQEIITANTAAETEELNRLRNQIVEYNNCLAKLQKLIEDGTEKLQTTQTQGAEINGLMEEKIGMLRDSLQKSGEELAERLENLDKKLSERLDSVDKSMGEKTNEQLEERLSAMDENVHKECVKVYRNVQAVVVEESEKQKETLTAAATQMTDSGKKIGTVLKISVAALVFSLLSVALQVIQILSRLNVLSL